jgi:hypothetical protein
MLVDLAEAIKNHLVALPPEKWGDIKPGPKFPIKNTLDPDEVIKCRTKKIFIMPLRPQYDISGSKGGRALQPISTIKQDYIISSVIVTPFESVAEGDVSSWDEIKDVLKLREHLEKNIIRGVFPKYVLTSVETEEPVDIKLNERIFLCVTDYIYESNSC